VSTQPLKKPLATTENEDIATFHNYVSVSIENLESELMAIMRIAIAGSGGLAQHFAHFINQTPNLFIILSRAVSQRTKLSHVKKMD
jgi:hypothetical protein